MGSTTLASAEQYLSTSLRPDCDFVEGEIRERHVGERDHSQTQMALSAFLYNHRGEWGVHVYPEQRVQVTANRFRVPDICVVAGAEPFEQVLTSPPFLCIEILSKDDTMQEMQERIDDYLSFGVPYVWVVNPRNQKGYVYTREGSREAKDGVLRTEGPIIEVPLAGIFSSL
jgi:Uma2 family endonuclease